MLKIIIKESKKQESDILSLLKGYSTKLKEIGYNVDKLKFLGKGTKGEAYLMADKKVIKVTLDPTEVKASAAIAGEDTRYLAKIEKVFRFGRTGYSGIVMENLDKISKEEMNFWNELVDTGFLREIMDSPKTWEQVMPVLKKRWIEEWDKTTVNDMLEKCKKYNFPQMLEELHKYGITFYDFHGDNIMKRNSENVSVVIDLGYSKQTKQTTIPVLERAL